MIRFLFLLIIIGAVFMYLTGRIPNVEPPENLDFSPPSEVVTDDPEPEPDPEPVEEPEPAPDPDPIPETVTETEPEPEPEPVPVLFELDHFPPGDLLPGSSRTKSNVGHTDETSVAPRIRFPIERGPAFLNSQILHPGGGGYDDGEWPAVLGSEVSPENYRYPWRDNFCEVRYSSNGLCAGNQGHQGQDIRPASCDNGEYWAVAPERVRVRNIGSTHLINLYGLESGFLYTFLHTDKPRPAYLVNGAVIEKGQRIGRVSNISGGITENCPTARCTSVHLHFEIWHGATELGAWNAKGVASHSPYTSLVVSYLDMIDNAPADEDWTTPLALPSSNSVCKAP